MARSLKTRVVGHLRELEALPTEELLNQRYEKFRRMGAFIEELPAPYGAPGE
jgi:acetyl-CoA carboxylase carboxyl transferase subunit alpha